MKNSGCFGALILRLSLAELFMAMPRIFAGRRTGGCHSTADPSIARTLPGLCAAKSAASRRSLSPASPASIKRDHVAGCVSAAHGGRDFREIDELLVAGGEADPVASLVAKARELHARTASCRLPAP